MPTIFKISSALSNLVLDVPLDGPPISRPSVIVGNKAGSLVQQWTDNSSGGPNQEWTLQTQLYAPGFQIVNKQSGLVIAVSSSSKEDVTLQPTGFDPSQGTTQPETPQLDQQLWIPLLPNVANPAGYSLINKFSNLVLDVPMSLSGGKDGTAQGLPIQQFDNNSGANQQWTFVQAPGHTLPLVSIEATGSAGGDSALQINGTGFTSYVGEIMHMGFYGIPVSGTPGSVSKTLGSGAAGTTAIVQPGGTFSIVYDTPSANVTTSYAQATSQWVSCYITYSGALVAISSVQLLYFVSTSG
jgi:hypothetical protein